MSNKLTEQDLMALGAVFEDALEIADPDGFEPIPDGDYMCQVVLLEITKTKTTNKLMATWRFKIAEGEEGAGRLIFKNSIIEDNPRNMKRLVNDMGKFGIEVNSLEELVTQLDSVLDEFCVVQLKTDSQNRQWISIDVPEV